MIKNFLMLMVIFTLAACTGAPAFSEANDAEVYRAALQFELKTSSLDGVVINNTLDATGLDTTGDYLKKNFPGLLTDEIFSNLISSNQSSRSVEPAFSQVAGLILISKEKFNQFFQGGAVQDGWKSFYQNYPAAKGLVTLSGVGYNRDHTQAILIVGVTVGPLAGHGTYIFLEKKSGGWQVVKNAMAWIS